MAYDPRVKVSQTIYLPKRIYAELVERKKLTGVSVSNQVVAYVVAGLASEQESPT